MASQLHRHHRLRIPGGKSVHIGEDHLLSAVGAEGSLVFAADDGEGVEHVGHVFPGQAVEGEVEVIEPDDCQRRLVISAYSHDCEFPRLFKTQQHPRFKRDFR